MGLAGGVRGLPVVHAVGLAVDLPWMAVETAVEWPVGVAVELAVETAVDCHGMP